jgi:hypothetical protein
MQFRKFYGSQCADGGRGRRLGVLRSLPLGTTLRGWIVRHLLRAPWWWMGARTRPVREGKTTWKSPQGTVSPLLSRRHSTVAIELCPGSPASMEAAFRRSLSCSVGSGVGGMLHWTWATLARGRSFVGQGSWAMIQGCSWQDTGHILHLIPSLHKLQHHSTMEVETRRGHLLGF